MPFLTQSDISRINTVLKNKQVKVKATAAWRRIHTEYSIGLLEAGHLYFEFAERDQLHQLVRSDTGIDLRSNTLKGDRTSVAGNQIDEKWGSESVQLKRIYCTSHNSPLSCKNSPIDLPEGSALWLEYTAIDLSTYQKIIIVENLETLAYWHRFKLLSTFTALIVYRGHDQSAKAVINFIAQLPKHISLVVFSDPDPAGLSITMNTKGAHEILIPEDIFKLKNQTHQQRFQIQLAKYPHIKTHALAFSVPFQAYCKTIINTGIAISQEKLCSQQTPLTLLQL